MRVGSLAITASFLYYLRENAVTLLTFYFRDCYSEAECTWCEYTDLGQQIATPCCRLKEDCYFGKTKPDKRDTCGMCYI